MGLDSTQSMQAIANCVVTYCAQHLSVAKVAKHHFNLEIFKSGDLATVATPYLFGVLEVLSSHSSCFDSHNCQCKDQY